jgi:integrase
VHGFRHSFKTLCREVSIDKEVHDAITGHTSGGAGATYGTMPIARMAEALRSFPTVAQLAQA